jgi:hypothetical protein
MSFLIASISKSINQIWVEALPAPNVSKTIAFRLGMLIIEKICCSVIPGNNFIVAMLLLRWLFNFNAFPLGW